MSEQLLEDIEKQNERLARGLQEAYQRECELRTALSEANARGDAWRDKFHADTKEMERLRVAVEAAGGLCDCGHVEAQHNRDLGVCDGPGSEYVVCSCLCFKEATQPGEGEGR